MGRYTRQALSPADALHTDCLRDARLARQWGYPEAKPVYVLPGSGGVKRDIFFPPAQEELEVRGELLVVNPRGMRAYVRNDTFFKAISLATRKNPSLRYACTSMEAEPQAERWLRELDIGKYVNLLPRLEHTDMARLFRQAQIVVSPSEHDGTPNTLLEAMACGSFPIAGDLESLREWIIPGVNGLLFDPDDPEDLAQAILTAASRVDLRKAAEEYNLRLVSERAEYSQVMASAADFYRQLSASSAASNWLGF
jgi:glycosyltransferase involved in cell wall biosynthesis